MNPKTLTLGQAAKVCGRSKPTLSNALKNGRLSYIEKTPSGYKIDPAELNRVFPYSLSNLENNQSLTHSLTPSNTVGEDVLRAKLDASERRLEDANNTINDLRMRLDRSEAARERQDLVLADSRVKTPPKGFLSRLFG